MYVRLTISSARTREAWYLCALNMPVRHYPSPRVEITRCGGLAPVCCTAQSLRQQTRILRFGLLGTISGCRPRMYSTRFSSLGRKGRRCATRRISYIGMRVIYDHGIGRGRRASKGGSSNGFSLWQEVRPCPRALRHWLSRHSPAQSPGRGRRRLDGNLRAAGYPREDHG